MFVECWFLECRGEHAFPWKIFIWYFYWILMKVQEFLSALLSFQNFDKFSKLIKFLSFFNFRLCVFALKFPAPKNVASFYSQNSQNQDKSPKKCLHFWDNREPKRKFLCKEKLTIQEKLWNFYNLISFEIILFSYSILFVPQSVFFFFNTKIPNRLFFLQKSGKFCGKFNH